MVSTKRIARLLIRSMEPSRLSWVWFFMVVLLGGGFWVDSGGGTSHAAGASRIRFAPQGQILKTED